MTLVWATILLSFLILTSCQYQTQKTESTKSTITSSTSDSIKVNYSTIKYNSQGQQLWLAQYNTPDVSYDQANAIAIDNNGNTYITGEITIKYDKNGKQIWLVHEKEMTYSIAVDGIGNVFVSGDNATVKYNKNGNKQWKANSISDARNLVIDKSGNVYVAGGGNAGLAVVKYNGSSGKPIWTWESDYSGRGSSAFAIALDQYNNVYVTGYIKSETSIGVSNYLTTKLDNNGHPVWTSTYAGPGNYDDVAYCVALDVAGNVYVTGRSFGINNYDYATIKYDSAGNQLWVSRYNGTANGDDLGYRLIVDSDGAVYVTGESERDNNGRDYATIKYDANGNQLWVARYSESSNSNNEAFALAEDISGNVYVTGQSGVYGSGPGAYSTVKYNSDGEQLWAASYQGPSNGFAQANAITVDEDGNVYVTGASGRRPEINYLRTTSTQTAR